MLVLVDTKEVSGDHDFPDVFRVQEAMVLVQSISFGISIVPSSVAFNRVVLSNFRFKAHHWALVVEQAIRV